MKTVYLKIFMLFIICTTINCKAQTVSDYISFYNQIAPKLNTVANTKVQYFGQEFYKFKNNLENNNIAISNIAYETKTFNSNKIYILAIRLFSNELSFVGLKEEYQLPVIWITFENEIPTEIKNMVLQYHGEWNNDFATFFSMMKIESIKFTGINGYDNSDRTAK